MFTLQNMIDSQRWGKKCERRGLLLNTEVSFLRLMSLDNPVNYAQDHKEEQKRDSLQYSLGNETNCNNFKLGALKKKTSHYNIFSISLKYCTLVIITTNFALFQFKSKLSLPQIYTLKIL